MKINNRVILEIKYLIFSTISVLSLYLVGGNGEIPLEVKKNVFYVPFIRILLHLKYSIRSFDVIAVILLVCFYFIFKTSFEKDIDKKRKIWQMIFSVTSAFILLLCESYYKIASWDYVFGSRTTFILSIIRILGWGSLIYCALCWLDLHKLILQDSNRQNIIYKKKSGILKIAGIIFFCWLPYIIMLFPGCFASDVQDEIAQVYNDIDHCWTAKSIVLLDENVILNNHHPVVYTKILQLVLLFGKIIGSYEWAFEIYCITQCLIMIAIFSYALYIMKRENLKQKYYNIAFLFFSFNPIFPIYGMTVVKDVLFSAFFFLAIIILYEIVICKSFVYKKLIFLSLTLFLLMLMRNNGYYIVLCLAVFAVILSFIKKLKLKHLIMALLIPCISLQILINGLLFPMLNISQGSIRELFSIPFQQTARYISEKPDEISESEKIVISTILYPNDDISKIAQEYNPELADPVKNGFNKNSTTQNLIDYIKVWGKQLMRHPTIYVQAFLNMNYRWFSFYGNTFVNSTYITQDGLELDSIVSGFNGAGGFGKVRQTVAEILRTLEKIPLSAIVLKHATYTWIYLGLFIYMIAKRKWDCFFVVAMVYINYLICFVGPVGYSRYAYPMICCLPFIIYIIFRDSNNLIEEEHERKVVFKG